MLEESIEKAGRIKNSEKAKFLEPLVSGSIKQLNDAGKSLGLIRPKNPRFTVRPRKLNEIEDERASFQQSARQLSMLDKELEGIEPTPYEFRFKFADEAEKHDYRNGDWEAHAMYWAGIKKHGKSEKEVLGWMDQTFNVEYPKKGVLFAVGNMASRPQTWQLLGVLRVDTQEQDGFAF